MNYLILLLTICTVLSIKKPPDLDPPNTTAKSTKSTSKSPPSTTTKSTTKKPPTTSTWDPPTTTVVYDEPGDCDFESDCQWKSSTTGKLSAFWSWFLTLIYFSPDIYIGCYDDHGRLLPTNVFSNASNSRTVCLEECRSRGFYLAGLQFGKECWCGSEGRLHLILICTLLE